VFKNLLFGIAIFGLGWGASFGAGAAWGRRSVASPVQAQVVPAGQFVTGGAAGAGAGAGAAGAGAAGQGSQGGPVRVAGGATAGTVNRVEGQTLVVDAANGQQTRVTLTDQTRIVKEGVGTAADLTAGNGVTVVSQGQPAADGTVTAAAVTILPPGTPLPAAGGPGGQGGQGGQGVQRRPGQAG
jgi:hypothetical protein